MVCEPDVNDEVPKMTTVDWLIKHMKENGGIKIPLDDIGRVISLFFRGYPLYTRVADAEYLVKQSAGRLRLHSCSNIHLALSDTEKDGDRDVPAPPNLEVYENDDTTTSSIQKVDPPSRCCMCCVIL
ncbi:hypothetical protein QR680_003240 [Steinernema hermaphroditum]|uniref:Uncharacterized protein n=1 Tax=Steinernema hermaphroditum TaxID=289476 RepID=A0AA39H7S9_9BILA|nr:hypothetical protein QR680_003240 [Steinernema hermaphroditum]